MTENEKIGESNGEKSLTMEEIKKFPPERRISALKKFEEEKDRERKKAVEEEELAHKDLEAEEREHENEEKELKKEESKARQRDRQLEDVVKDEGISSEKEKKEETGGVSYGSHAQQLKDFYAVTSKVREKLPGVLERMASGSATRDDERFVDSYKQAMQAVKTETAYVSQTAKEQFYQVAEQLQTAEQYRSDGGKQQERQQGTGSAEDYRSA